MTEPERIRRAIRAGEITGTSRGLALGFVQCNLVILPRDFAYDFLVYCQRNPRACPLLEVGDPGDPEPRLLAPSADIRTDVARYAVWQDATGRAEERCLAVGIGIGSGYLFPTTFEHETNSDLVGERGVLMGCLAGVMEAQYEVLRAHGHTPSEAFNETVEELTQSLIRLVDENGMDWMYSNCSATAQRGALDWKPKFKKAVLPVFKELYQRVASGKEAERVIKACGAPNYQEQLARELAAIRNSEMWRAGAATWPSRRLPPCCRPLSTRRGCCSWIWRASPSAPSSPGSPMCCCTRRGWRGTSPPPPGRRPCGSPIRS